MVRVAHSVVEELHILSSWYPGWKDNCAYLNDVVSDLLIAEGLLKVGQECRIALRREREDCECLLSRMESLGS